MGEPFFDCQIGFVGCRAMCLKGIMGVKDFEENINRSETVSKNLPFPHFFWIECKDNEVLIEVFNHTKNLLDYIYLWLERGTLLFSPVRIYRAQGNLESW